MGHTTSTPSGSSAPKGSPGASPRPRRLFLSLGLRVTVPVVLLVVTVAIGVYLGLVHQSRLTLLSSKELAADMIVKLTSVSMMPAVVFGDPEEMARAVSNLARNPDVSDVELWGFKSSELGAAEGLLATFYRSGSGQLGRPTSHASQRFRDSDSIRVIEPIVNLEGQRVAALVVRFSTAREAAALALLSRQISYVSVATALCLAFAILLAIHRVVVRPIKRLEEAAARLARGEQYDLQGDRARVEDEVVRLAEKFGEMAEAVRDRELRLSVRSAELKLILDSVDQGFLTARVDGTLFPERSAIVEQWTGPLELDASISSLAALIDPEAAKWIPSAWDQLVEGFLPLELAIDQLPKQLHREGQQFSLAYHPVMLDEQLQRMVIVMTDITAELERQRVLAEQQEFAGLVDQLVRDRLAFRAFWSEASKLVATITDGSEQAPGVLLRDVHTLKGNARFFGLTRVSNLCHALETAMTERGEHVLTPRECAELVEIWESLRLRIQPLIQGATVFIEVSRDEYERLLDAVCKRKPIAQVEQLVRGLRFESASARLEHAKRVLVDTSIKLDKTPPRVEIRHDDLRLPPGPWAPFWSILSHVLSNAVDHGVESDEERLAAGKPLPSTVWLSTTVVAGDVIIEVRDDGRGIDWERARSLAVERGLPSQSQADLEQALLSNGFSLRQEVSQISGRGVGLAAVQTVVTAMGGEIELESTPHVGTTWRFRFSLATLSGSDSDDIESKQSLNTDRPPVSAPNLRPSVVA
jgi:signal transduction histidine kinase/HAMP domain-containing protein